MKLVQQLASLGFTSSVGEARRKVAEGVVRVNSQKIDDLSSKLKFQPGDEVRIGHRLYKVPQLVLSN